MRDDIRNGGLWNGMEGCVEIMGISGMPEGARMIYMERQNGIKCGSADI